MLRIESLLEDLFPPEAPAGAAAGGGGGGERPVTVEDLKAVCRVCGVEMGDRELRQARES